MNLNSKIVIALTLSIAITIPTFIAGFPNSARAIERITNGAVCLRLETASSSIKTKIAENRERWDARRLERAENWTEKTASLQDKLEQKRVEADDKRDDKIEALKTEYPDAEQREAIEAFQATVEQAITDRRAAFDAAHKAYRDGVASALQKRHDAYKTALTDQKAAIDAALAKAKTDCAAGIDPATVRAELQAAIKKAREDFQTDRAAVDQIKPQLETLRETRKASIKKAQDEFKESLAEARETLKEVLDAATQQEQTEEETSN